MNITAFINSSKLFLKWLSLIFSPLLLRDGVIGVTAHAYSKVKACKSFMITKKLTWMNDDGFDA